MNWAASQQHVGPNINLPPTNISEWVSPSGVVPPTNTGYIDWQQQVTTPPAQVIQKKNGDVIVRDESDDSDNDVHEERQIKNKNGFPIEKVDQFFRADHNSSKSNMRPRPSRR